MLIKFTIFLMLAMPVFIHSAEEAKDTRMKDEKMQEKERPIAKGWDLAGKTVSWCGERGKGFAINARKNTAWKTKKQKNADDFSILM